MSNATSWRHRNPDPHSKIDRIALREGKYVTIMKDGTSLPPTARQQLISDSINGGELVPCKDEPLTKDDEIALSMLVFIEQYGSRMIEATAIACRMIAEQSRKELDGTSAEAWDKAGGLIDQAYSCLAD